MIGFLFPKASDESLMLKYQQGDSRAFEALYSRHKDSLFAFLYRSHVDLALIEEIAQEAWIAVINSAQNYRPTAKFKTYLYAIAHRKLIDYWRSNNYKITADTENSEAENTVENLASPVSMSANNSESSYDLLLALETLSKEQQQAFLLKEEGFSRKEIAIMTNSNEETIKSRIRYATNNLKKVLEVQYAQ